MRLVAAATLALALTTIAAAQQSRPPTPRTPATQSPATRPPAKAPAVPAREMVVPFAVGETLTYDVSWSQFLTAGTAVAKVTEKKASNGSTAYAIVADGKPVPLVARFYSVYYKMESLLDTFTGLSQWTGTYTEENGRKRQTSMRFDRGARRAFYEDQTDAALKDDFATPPNVQDGLATLYSIRGRAFKAGERFVIPVADNGMLYSAEFTVAGPQRVSVPFGDVNAWNLKIAILDEQRQPVANNSAAWISADARKLPVKLQSDLPVGSFVLALRDARP